MRDRSLIAITNPGDDSLIHAPSEYDDIGGKDCIGGWGLPLADSELQCRAEVANHSTASAHGKPHRERLTRPWVDAASREAGGMVDLVALR
jgi:hypothetical protein